MKVKRLLIAGIALLGLASVSGVSVNASSYFGGYEREATYSVSKYVRRPIHLEKLSHTSYFAGVHSIGGAQLHRGERIGIVPFNHMGRDGYVVHIPGRSGIYYAPTNSHNWFSGRHRTRRVRRIRRSYGSKSKLPRRLRHMWYGNVSRIGFKDMKLFGRHPYINNGERRLYITGVKRHGSHYNLHVPNADAIEVWYSHSHLNGLASGTDYFSLYR